MSITASTASAASASAAAALLEDFNFLQEILDFTAVNPTNLYYAQVFWYVIAAVIGFYTIVNISRKWIFTSSQTALGAGIFTRPITLAQGLTYRYPLGKYFRLSDWVLIVAYFGLVMAMIYIQSWNPGFRQYATVGFRAGWITVAQLPLAILLTGKKNVIGYLTGTSYERLNILHRWVARIIFFTATLHMIYLYRNFSIYGLVKLEWQTDTCPPTGTAAWVILFWIVLSSIAPIRNLRHEIFVAQHVISYIGFTVAVLYHMQPYPEAIWKFAWIAAGLFGLDRIIRLAIYLWNGLSAKGITCSATIQALPGGVTQVTINNSRLRNWAPGQFVLLSLPKIGLLQSHPFTIASVPSRNDPYLKFLIREKNGFTKNLLEKAKTSAEKEFMAFVDGPYGDSSSILDLDRVVLIAGGVGASYTIPVFLDLAKKSSRRTIDITFIWIVREDSHISWFVNEINEALSFIDKINVHAYIFVTSSSTSASADLELKTKENMSPPNFGLSEAVTVSPGRPGWSELLSEVKYAAEETGIIVSGPSDMTVEVTNLVSNINLVRAREGPSSTVHLHVENFNY